MCVCVDDYEARVLGDFGEILFFFFSYELNFERGSPFESS